MKLFVVILLSMTMGCAKAVFTAEPELESPETHVVTAQTPTPPRAPQPISGLWEFAEPMRSAPFLVAVKIEFFPSTMNTTIICIDGKNKISKTLSVRSQITESEIRSLESKDFSLPIPNSTFTCSFRMNAGDTYFYTISADGQTAEMQIALNPSQGSKTLIKIK